MLQDFLVRDYGELEILPEDRKALYGLKGHKGLDALLKVCIGSVLKLEGEIMQEGTKLDYPTQRERVGARNAYHYLAVLMLNPPKEEIKDD